jgi:hypothetical protein
MNTISQSPTIINPTTTFASDLSFLFIDVKEIQPQVISENFASYPEIDCIEILTILKKRNTGALAVYLSEIVLFRNLHIALSAQQD